MIAFLQVGLLKGNSMGRLDLEIAPQGKAFSIFIVIYDAFLKKLAKSIEPRVVNILL
jgi:hypothetical protein